MKKIILFAIACATLILGSCRHETFTIDYSIGCVGYQYGTIQGSEWEDLQSYFETHVDYNKTVSFEGKSLAEADMKARQYCDEQIKKIDADYVCSLLHGEDYFDYGIATINAGGDYRYIKTIRFKEYGTYELTY